MVSTMRPPPLSGTSLTPFESQVDQQTGMAALMAPQAIRAMETDQGMCSVASIHTMMAARKAGSSPSVR